MNKSKNFSHHYYTREQNEWIIEHPNLRRSELVRKFNKKFDTDVSPLAIAKRKQRMLLQPVTKKDSKKNKHKIKHKKFNLSGESFKKKELLKLIREQGRLIEKLIEKL